MSRTSTLRQARFAVIPMLVLTIAGLTGCTSGTSSTAQTHQLLKPSSPITTVSSPTSIPTHPSSGSSDEGILNSVSCVPSGQCVAVGETGVTFTRPGPQAQWATASQPQTNPIASVSCVSGTECMGVGNDGQTATFSQWNGASWTELPAPTGTINGQSPIPSQVSCTALNFCVAVGGSIDNPSTFAGGETAVIERWDGLAWAAPETPVLATTHPGNVIFWSVSCVSSVFCMAVGQTEQIHTLAEEWDGSQWRTTPTPPVDDPSAGLESVSCTSAEFCFALGTQESSDAGPSEPETTIIAEVWNGSSWAKVPAPIPFGGILSLSRSALACTSPSQCSAVWSSTWALERQGGPTPAHAGFPAVSQLWNGSSWSVLSMPNPTSSSGQFNILYDESCSAAIDCVAAGTTADGYTSPTMLIESWDGSRWTEDQVPTF